jgi:hypothetical protein
MIFVSYQIHLRYSLFIYIKRLKFSLFSADLTFVMEKWFVIQNERVTGPFTSDEMKAQVADGHISAESLIWGRPLKSWTPAKTWIKELSQAVQNAEKKVSYQMWHYAVEGVSKGPISRTDLVNEIKNLHSKGEILVWTKGMKAWADLFEFYDLIDEIGINRREHPRAHIQGSVVLKLNDQTIIGQLQTLSPGGFGATQINNQLSIGTVVTAEIRSEALGQSVTGKAAVQYLTDNGFVGFKFTAVNMETKARIHEYIRTTKVASERAA